jgi:hypothetical protein
VLFAEPHQISKTPKPALQTTPKQHRSARFSKIMFTINTSKKALDIET